MLALIALVIGFAAGGAPAHAQSFRLNRFRSVERPDDGFGVRRLGEFGHLRLGALATLDYANDPLVIERDQDQDVQTVVQHQLTVALALSLSLWDRAIVYAGLDAVPLLDGPSIPLLPVPKADGAGLGDVSVGARVRLVGEADDLFGLGVQAGLIVPTAGTQAYRGEDGLAMKSDLIAEFRPKIIRVSLNAGVLVRPRQQLLNARIDDELTYGVGLGLPVHRQVDLIAELSGGFALQDFGKRISSSFEWLVGPKYRSRHGLYAGAAVGTGLTSGVGSPDVRAVLQLGYLTPVKRPAPKPVLPEIPAPPVDPDNDGILGQRDMCPDIPEDADTFEDEDGCPEPDNDKDGLLDVADGCRDAPEDDDGFEDGDGCPDPDNDQDGVLDLEDKCRDQKGVAEEQGCPAKVALTEEGELTIFEQILFENNQAVILPESFPILEAVKRALDQHEQIRMVRIEGHTDSVGQNFKNLKLSQARAGAVAHWLVEHGVEKGRLTAFGCGEKHPVADDATEEGRAQNRRVLFQVVDPGPPDQARIKPPAGCIGVPVK